MDEHGTTSEQLGEISVTQREHAVRNEKAYFDEPVELDEYLNAPPIADPIRLLDCVIPVNGGFGVLLTSAERAGELDVPPVSIDGFGECHNHDVHGTPDMTRTGIEIAGPAACEMAGIDPADADFVQLYDDYPIIVAMQLEDLGVCEKGDGGTFVAETDISYDGELPVNTSGGQISAGQVGLAGGFLQLVEGVRQLRSEGGDRQVPGAQQGIVTGVGGVEYGKNLRSTNAVVLSGGER
jgi:acetyl-CoA acetyltransferase